MKKLGIPFAAALVAGAIATPLSAQGRLGLVEQGEYVCALPGDATGAAWVVQEGKGFSIVEGSSYRTERGNGTYLAEGRQITFTRGPLKGMKLMQLGSGLLQEIGRDGKLGRLRCHRAGPLR